MVMCSILITKLFYKITDFIARNSMLITLGAQLRGLTHLLTSYLWSEKGVENNIGLK